MRTNKIKFYILFWPATCCWRAQIFQMYRVCIDFCEKKKSPQGVFAYMGLIDGMGLKGMVFEQFCQFWSQKAGL